MAKNDRVWVVVTPEQRAQWEARAEKQGRNLSNFIRNAVGAYVMMLDMKDKREQK